MPELTRSNNNSKTKNQGGPMWSEDIPRPIPRSERSLQVKIARKVHAADRQKINLDGFYKFLAPGSTVRKIGPATRVIKGPNRLEIRVRNSVIAKFRTRNEGDTELGVYIDRRPKKV